MFRALTGLFMFVVLLPSPVSAQQPTGIRLAWDASFGADIAGYIIDYGTSPGVYTRTLDVGPRTDYEISDIPGAWAYYFTVRAYSRSGQVSERSRELVYTPSGDVSRRDKAPTDLIFHHQKTGSVARWLMTGLEMASSQIVGSPVETAWRFAGVGDFNGDGKRDFVWQHKDGWIAVWLMNGAQVLSANLVDPDRVTDSAWRIAAVADMDQDGKADLVWQHTGNGYVAVWFMDGLARRESQVTTPSVIANLDWMIVGAGDFNGDALPDLLWRNNSNGTIAVWHMNGARQLSSKLLPPAVTDAAWKVAAVADLNGDRISDVIWQHTDGRFGVWVLDGPGLFVTAPSPAAVNDPMWRMVGGR
jgi:hypothetical protein